MFALRGSGAILKPARCEIEVEAPFSLLETCALKLRSHFQLRCLGSSVKLNPGPS